MEHVPGKYLYSADTLSRAPIQDSGDTSFQEEVETFVNGITEHFLPATRQQLQVYCIATFAVKLQGWPKKNEVTPGIRPNCLYSPGRSDRGLCHY